MKNISNKAVIFLLAIFALLAIVFLFWLVNQSSSDSPSSANKSTEKVQGQDDEDVVESEHDVVPDPTTAVEELATELAIIVGNNSSTTTTTAITTTTSTSTTTTTTTTAPPDTTPPTIPTNIILSTPSAYVVNMSWTASTDTSGITEYVVYRDGNILGNSPDTDYIDYTVVPGNTYDYSVLAVDGATNSSGQSSEPSITLASTSMWIDGDNPQAQDDDPSTLELGVKFRPLVDGKLTGIRFYKATGAQNTHNVALWTSGGASLATATSTGETLSGWQIATFATPVDVVAGTTYVASYYSADGLYSYIPGYFASQGISTQYLTALASGVDGNNGVFRYGSSGFPTTSFDNTSYMVDVTFTPNPNATGPSVTTIDNTAVFAGFPGSNNTGVDVGVRIPMRDRGITVYQPNVTIENVDIQDSNTNKCLDIRSTNTTIDQVKIRCSGAYGIFQDVSSSGLVVEDSELTSLSALTPLDRAILTRDGATISRMYIHGTQRGIWVGDNTIVQDTFIGNNVFSTAGQTTAITTGGGSDHVIVRRNNLRTSASSNANSSISIFPGIPFGGANDDFLIDLNLFATGADYCVLLGHTQGVEQPNTNMVFTNNKFGTDISSNCGVLGPVGNWSTGATGNIWSNNTWLGGPNDGQAVPEP